MGNSASQSQISEVSLALDSDDSSTLETLITQYPRLLRVRAFGFKEDINLVQAALDERRPRILRRFECSMTDV